MRCEVLPDWFTFTIRGMEPNEVIRDVLGMDTALFEKKDFTWNGYKDVEEFQNIRVASNGRDDENWHNMGICVSMTGNGCRNFETFSHLGGKAEEGGFSENFMRLFQFLDSREDVNITRLDVACDDRSGILSREDIVDRFSNHGIRSRTKKRMMDIGEYEEDGFTLYIGSEKSDFRTKIYDKEAESKANKLVDTGHWIRVEMKMKDENAEAFVHNLVSGKEVGQLAAQVLNDKVSFINLDDSNITRCSVCEWWAEFVNEVEKVRLVTRRAVEHSVAQLDHWIKNQVAGSLYIISMTLGMQAIKDYISDAKRSVLDNPKKYAVIEDYRKWVGAAIKERGYDKPPTIEETDSKNQKFHERWLRTRTRQEREELRRLGFAMV